MAGAVAGGRAAAGVLPATGRAFAQEAETIKIVSSLPLTGSSKGQTDTIVNAISMAIEEAAARPAASTSSTRTWTTPPPPPARGTRPRRPRTPTGRPSDANIMVYIGTSTPAPPRSSIPILQPDRPGHDQPGQHLPRPDQAGQGRAERAGRLLPERLRATTPASSRPTTSRAPSAPTGRQALGAKNVYVLDDTELYGKGIADVFADAPQSRPDDRSGREGIDAKATDYRALAEKIQRANPDVDLLRRHHPEQRRQAVSRTSAAPRCTTSS